MRGGIRREQKDTGQAAAGDDRDAAVECGCVQRITRCARLFNRFGISALRLSKPYHDMRRPAELERSDYAVSANVGRTIAACRQAVVGYSQLHGLAGVAGV